MTVSRTAPDGSLTVEQVTVNGITYDLPTWLTAEEFEAGVNSQDDKDPLSSLTSLILQEWDELEDYRGNKTWIPGFTATWLVPFGQWRELVVARFTPVSSSTSDREFGWHEKFFKTRVTPDGYEITMDVYEDFEIYDIQVLIVPEDVTQYTYVPKTKVDPRRPSYHHYPAEQIEEAKDDFAEFIRDVEDEEGFVETITDLAGNKYTAVVKVHQD